MNQNPQDTPIPLQKQVVIINPQGLHARPADMLVRCADGFDSTITIQKGSETVDCRSILSLLTLGATEGTELTLTAQGHDAEAALAAIGELFELGFHELGQPSQ
ncbi:MULTISPECIES: HPr family phosphocarrier protein [Rhodopirellula]|uniref:Phosphotransferase system, phosphocarrier HPr protein n=1 Tax=Rhodopirellula sallentina SM41 TaxID=1263870 RepID=M5UJD7_9BACT|nr:HPr family phosphocarrier protein [Rhodopirellula sallentina]EMI57961.1 Phosphotransferase system, phosphocarrier HPr protein [Rhodopirellula sallentina SM41]